MGAQGGDHHMGEVLADAGPALEHLVQGRRDVGGAGLIVEIGLDS
jgi:hypothetical protein